MKSHYSARELAGLPGMPKTERDVRLRAAREGWEARLRDGRREDLAEEDEPPTYIATRAWADALDALLATTDAIDEQIGLLDVLESEIRRRRSALVNRRRPGR